jgi:hypothetical protein
MTRGRENTNSLLLPAGMAFYARQCWRVHLMTAQKVAIVTAAGSEIGEDCARRLSEDSYTPVLLSPSGSVVGVAEELGGDGFEGSVPSRASAS